MSGAFSVAAALSSFKEDFVFPTINYEKKDPDCDLIYVVNKAKTIKVKNVLVIITAPSGGNTCIILRRFES